jgi:hypothetical protein
MARRPKKTSLAEHAFPSAVKAADELWNSLIHLNRAIVALKNVGLFSATHDAMLDSFGSLSSLHTQLRLWIDENRKQLELPEDK